ncbi:TPA: uracil-DNA glycosylase, partial [Legionella pneumophila]|nr:uracil-DNA glycosylase [Legionella pneumophila]
MYENLLVGCHEEWKEILMKALNTMDSCYLKQIQEDSHWLPGLNQLFSAFSLPLSQ